MDNGHVEIAKSLMKEIMYDSGVVDRWHPEKYPEKWVNKIAPIAGKFFDLHPKLLTNENIELLATGSEECDGTFDGLENYEGFQELNDVLNEYHDNI